MFYEKELKKQIRGQRGTSKKKKWYKITCEVKTL